MSRKLSVREKVLLVFLGLAILALVYIKLFLQPVSSRIDSLKMLTADAAEMTEINMAKAEKIKEMQDEIEEIKNDPDARMLPAYDNIGPLMTDLNALLNKTESYSLQFDDISWQDYVAVRTVHISMVTDSYQKAASIIREMYDSDEVLQISNLSFSVAEDSCSVSLTVSYYEMSEN